MLKFSLATLLIFYIFILTSCNTKQNTQDINTDCEIIGMVYDTFMQTNRYEFKYMKLDSFYICQFAPYQVDTSLIMQNLPYFTSSAVIKFDDINLIKIGNDCLGISNIKYIDSAAALDTMMLTKTTNKVIWGITNYKRNSKFVYLAFGAYFSKRTIIVNQYLFELIDNKYKLIKMEE
jgi:hypothetical protein